MVVKSMSRSIQSDYITSTTATYPTQSPTSWYPFTSTTTNTNYPTQSSTSWYPFTSTTTNTNYPTQSSTYPYPWSTTYRPQSSTYTYPWYTTYPTQSSTSWYPFRSTTTNTNYPTQSSTYPYPWSTTYRPQSSTYTYPWYTTYPTQSSTSWYPFRSTTTNTNYPTQSSTYPYPWYTTYPTQSSTSWYPFRSTTTNTNYPTQSSTYPYPWYTTYPTQSSTSWYPFKSSTPQPSTYTYPWYTTYRTQSSTPWYPYYTTRYPTYTTTGVYPTGGFSSTPTTSPYPTSTWPSSTIMVEPFTTIIIPVAKNVILERTSTPTDYTVKFICSMNMYPYVTASVTNMTLLMISSANCHVIIRAYEFQTIHIGNIASLTTSGNLIGNQLAIKVDGASNILLNNIVYNVVEVILSSTSSATLSGVAQRLDVIQLGQGSFDARFLSTVNATVFTKNSGLVKIKSNDYLSLTIDGPGDVIWCSPRVNIKENSGIYNTPPKIVFRCD